jgi:hypothetical protein
MEIPRVAASFLASASVCGDKWITFASSYLILDYQNRGGQNNSFYIHDPGYLPGLQMKTTGTIMGKLEGKVALVSGRTGTAEEIVKAVVFLASDDSSFVNAAELVVDAGMSLV